MILTKILPGSILLAEPSLIGDAQFQRSVILIAEYNKKGIVGFITNKPLSYTISEILPEITEEFRIYNGGPVEKESLYFLHTKPNLIPNSIKICDDVYWGGDFDVVMELIINKKVTPYDIKFFLGYTGWHYDQLHKEISNNNWIIQNLTKINTLIRDNTDSFWKNTLLNLGGEYKIWANSPENPDYN